MLYRAAGPSAVFGSGQVRADSRVAPITHVLVASADILIRKKQTLSPSSKKQKGVLPSGPAWGLLLPWSVCLEEIPLSTEGQALVVCLSQARPDTQSSSPVLEAWSRPSRRALTQSDLSLGGTAVV